MHIQSLTIKNFKCYDEFSIEFNKSVNIIVGNNEAGKSTLLEAIHLCLTGMYRGKYLKNDINQYIFNEKVTNEFLSSVQVGTPQSPPSIYIEIYLYDDGTPEIGMLKGNDNSKRIDAPGVSILIEFNDCYRDEYSKLIKDTTMGTIPIEYYSVTRKSFARKEITALSIPLKSAFIDSSFAKHAHGSDIYLSRIIKDCLEEQDRVSISQAHRQMRENFMKTDSVQIINEKLTNTANLSSKKVSVSVDLATQNAWESSLMPFLDDIPFHNIGKGEQSIAKTALALSHKKSKEASVILIEEPENHLSHVKLNELLQKIESFLNDKQLIISTHSSFVANKLGLENIILLNAQQTVKLHELSEETYNFFKKLSGYDILRLILCSKAILVEGDSDELIVQKSYIHRHGNLPIENGIDVISVGTSFLRFLEISDKISKQTCVVCDNDGNIDALKEKYKNYIGTNKKDFIFISFSQEMYEYDGKLDKYNSNTLEPEIVRANENNLALFETVFEKDFATMDNLLDYMRKNKTNCALSIFNTASDIKFPIYIEEAITDVSK